MNNSALCSASCSKVEVKSASISASTISAIGCDLNWSMQRLISNKREEDVAYEEVPAEYLLFNAFLPAWFPGDGNLIHQFEG
jgi:hypothetical protein